MKTSIREIDEVIHRERIDKAKQKVTHERTSSDIPEGTFIEVDSKPYLFKNGKLHLWTPFGYEGVIPLPKETTHPILTPSSIVNAFQAGYVPKISCVSLK